jgi:probable phosphoglycerate mutase
MTKFILCRHGHVEGISPERFRGRTDLALTKQGRAEAQRLADRIVSSWQPKAIYTSPMGRCIETGRAVGKACGVMPQPLEDLNDINYGDWQGKTHAEVERNEPQQFAQWYSAPQLIRFSHGDSLQDLTARCADILRKALKRHPNETVVLVGHDSVNRVLLLECLGLPLSSYWLLAQNPCCVNEFDIHAGRTTIRRINETWHLEETGHLE